MRESTPGDFYVCLLDPSSFQGVGEQVGHQCQIDIDCPVNYFCVDYFSEFLKLWGVESPGKYCGKNQIILSGTQRVVIVSILHLLPFQLILKIVKFYERYNIYNVMKKGK